MSNRLIVTPPNEAIWHGLRAEDITSTESAALFDMSPYTTRFELWHRKHGKQVVDFEATGRMLWGTRLQDAIARGIAEDHGIKVRRYNAYVRLTDVRMGASFDFEIVGVTDGYAGRESRLRELYQERGPGILEIKNVDGLIFRDQWAVTEDREIEAPDHIEIQVQHQLHVIERAWSVIGVLVGGNAPKILVRDRHPDVGAGIEARIREFWQSVEAGTPPPPHYPDDAEFVARLYGFAEPGKVFDGRDDAKLATLCREYRDAADREKLAKEDKEVAKAKILEHIGDAERALLDDYTISAGLIGPAHVEFDRKGYRNFKLTPRKPAKAQPAAQPQEQPA
jgi:predicted phage-related endonuclease